MRQGINFKMDVIILGASPLGIEVYETIELINKKKFTYNFLGFLDDNEEKLGSYDLSEYYLGSLQESKGFKNTSFIFAIGSINNYYNRENILRSLNLTYNNLETIVHPNANVSKFSKIGKGTIISYNSFIGPHCKIGNGVIISPNTTINHNTIIKDYSIIASNSTLAGDVVIESNVYLGMNVKIKNNIKVEKFACVGMGSAVINNISEKTVNVGVPTKIIKTITF
jgi:sugar O-acyltransferase (sialic acid O-acetyltransferase NeuD family)